MSTKQLEFDLKSLIMNQSEIYYKSNNSTKTDFAEADELAIKLPDLDASQVAALERQQNRLAPSVRAALALKDTKKHWDLFYKRNGDRFYKDRHWILREFPELRDVKGGLLEAGCGAGALLFPLSEELPDLKPLYACDLSSNAVDIVKENPQYCEPLFRAFQADLCEDSDIVTKEIGPDGVGAVTAIFLLSALPPNLQEACISTLTKALCIGGRLMIRDYARYDMTQLRFGPGHKIQDNLYLRQDNTLSYFFTLEEMKTLLQNAGLKEERIGYVKRRTTNLKEGVDVPRLFLQACYVKTS